jgi:hypothetical protein
MGVLGGLPLLIIFVAILAKAFALVGGALNRASEAPRPSTFLGWAIGASLFAHAVTCVAVSYFDQSIAIFYLTLAAASTFGGTQNPAVTSADSHGFRVSVCTLPHARRSFSGAAPGSDAGEARPYGFRRRTPQFVERTPGGRF